VFELQMRFLGGRMSVEENERYGRPVNDENG
jgi:hypothetical protein